MSELYMMVTITNRKYVEICSTLPGKSDRSRNGFLGMGTAPKLHP